jgi:tetratricopeptide (TPR) repeat protein
MKKIFIITTLLVFILIMLPPRQVQADVAPPETPPGANLVPGNDSTQVRMLAETVLLTISEDPADRKNAIAKTEASFTMRNLGSIEEKMKVRFPLTFFNGNSDGFGNFPEIARIVVKIGGKTIPTVNELQPYFATDGPSYEEREKIPWAVFDVVFPPSQDVVLEVSYTVSGYGYYPYEAFRYILETGAGWKDTIGVADVIVRLPYEVTNMNVGGADADYAGYGSPTPGGTFRGNEVRWHFENLEPTWQDNIQILMVTPSLWESVLKEADTVLKNPEDGEAWGRLGKAYKEIVRMPKGYLREDPAGLEMFQLSRSAYEKCLELLPEDPVWHYGYADLLWAYYYFDIRGAGKGDPDGFLPLILYHLKTALDISPNTQQAIDLLTDISYSVPEAVQVEGDKLIFLGLTATPLPPTPWIAPTVVVLPSQTPESMPTLTDVNQIAPTQTMKPQNSQPQNQLCGSFALIAPLILGLLRLGRKRY